ncbi:extracellular solute-binding protein [Paenibacillus filicis]|uniref:Extracellular solute-binding protein n=1 Tax=Paenibacillus gyeongsangnamensis TaxID=3388067 RepID=A0ABT4QJN2_9BACL|nr:extracellular solute-binding protein [Paenibacillus filicis]MCZ8517078.1 extracellular solute-binding protein [Paenibacillus filicis]
MAKITRPAAMRSLVGVMMSVIVLSACGNNEGTPAGSKNDKLTIKIMSSLQTEPPDMNSAFWTGLEERTKVHLDIDWVPINDYINKVNLVLASGSIPEVLTVTDTNLSSLVDAINKGSFWELSEFLGDFSKYPNLKNNVPESAWRLLRYNGKIYGLPRTRPQIGAAEHIRKDWLDKLGLPVPKTMDELLVTLKKVVESDPDGNGKRDTIGLMFDESYRAAFGGIDPEYTPDGGLYPKQLSTAYTNMVEWYRKAYADGLMSQEFAIMKDLQYSDMFGAGLAAFYRKNPWHQYGLEQAAKKVQPDAKVELIPYLTGPKGTTAVLSPGFYGALYIPKSVPKEKVEKILQFYNNTASDEITKYITYGIEGVHHKVENGVIKMTDQGKKEINNTTIEPFVLKLDPWSKTDSPIAPQEVNLRNREKVKPELEVGKIDPFSVINSSSWVTQWPKYDGEFTSMRTQAIIGKITMEQYKSYIDQLRAKKEFGQAYKEFAENYKALFGK